MGVKNNKAKKQKKGKQRERMSQDNAEIKFYQLLS